MKEHLHQYAWIVYVFVIFFTSCDPGSASSERAIQSDSMSIAKGKLIFSQNCSYCHNIQQNGIGPGLAGLTEEVPVSWLAAFIRDPKKMIDSGDARSKEMYAKYQTI